MSFAPVRAHTHDGLDEGSVLPLMLTHAVCMARTGYAWRVGHAAARMTLRALNGQPILDTSQVEEPLLSPARNSANNPLGYASGRASMGFS